MTSRITRTLTLALAALGWSTAAMSGNASSARALPAHVQATLDKLDAVTRDDPLLHIFRNYHCYYVDPVPAPFRPSVMDETDFLFGVPVLDNVVYLGYLNLAAYVVKTSDGLVLIDAGGTPEQGKRILGWLEKAGYAKSDLKWIIVTHEHGDHFAGAKVLRDATGARIAAGADAIHDDGQGLPADLLPLDLSVHGRTVLKVGSSEFVLLPTPGHTPGTLSVFAPVTAAGRQHMASFWGGKGMRPNVTNLRKMLRSVDIFAAESRRLGVDVPLNTHSWGDATVSRLIDKVLAPELPNPFVLSAERNEANLQLLRGCTAAYLDLVVSRDNP